MGNGVPKFVRRHALQAALCLILAFTSGCGTDGPPSGTVSGRVTFQGEPVTSGVVNLTSQTLGIGASGTLGEDGQYHIADQLKTGEYKVIITLPPPPPPRPEDGPPKPQQELKNIPAKYRSEATSDLTATIHEGTNTADFDLKP